MKGLAEYARKHIYLKESPTKEVLLARTGETRLALLMFCVFGTIFCIVGAQSGLLGFFVGLVFGIGLVAIAFAIQVPGRAWMARIGAATVSAGDGQITVFRPLAKIHTKRGYSLNNMRWCIGKARQDSILRATTIANQEVVILYCYVGIGRFQVRQKVACGWTKETRARWIAFLTLAEVRKV